MTNDLKHYDHNALATELRRMTQRERRTLRDAQAVRETDDEATRRALLRRIIKRLGGDT